MSDCWGGARPRQGPDLRRWLPVDCGAGELKIIAAILERAVIGKILAHLGLNPQPPPTGQVREAGPHSAA